MKSCPALLLLLAATSLPLRSADFAWPGRGVVSLPDAAGWSLQGRPAEDSAFIFKCVPESGANAELLIALVDTPPDRVVDTANLKQLLLNLVQPQLATAVEKSPVPQKLKIPRGGGWYVQLTDSTLVGKPAVRGKFKIVRKAMVGLDAHALVIATMLFDDPEGPEPRAMLELVRGMRFRRAPGDESIVMSEKEGRILLTVPSSRIVLSLRRGDLRAEPTEAGGGTARPRYFLFNEPATGLNLSGWLEPAEKFEGMKTLWARDRDRMISGGIAVPRDESFAQVSGWEVVFYTVTAGNAEVSGSFLNCRAHAVRDGTWIELHLSLLQSATARNKLARVLEDARIEAKP